MEHKVSSPRLLHSDRGFYAETVQLHTLFL